MKPMNLPTGDRAEADRIGDATSYLNLQGIQVYDRGDVRLTIRSAYMSQGRLIIAVDPDTEWKEGH